MTESGSANKKQRTIQVKIGNQAARAMTPDQAADYLKTIAGKGWGAGRELKMTFDNGSTSTVALPRAGSSSNGSGGSGSGGNSGGSGDRNSSHVQHNTCTNTSASPIWDATTGNLSANFNNSLNEWIGSMNPSAITMDQRTTTTRADGMPCSEKEMKALMSMFVEIMGLQMNTERLNAAKICTKKAGSKGLFSFPSDLPPPPGGWPEDLMWPPEYEINTNTGSGQKSDESDDDSLPGLQDIPEEEEESMILLAQQRKLAASVSHKPQPVAPVPPVPGSKEISPIDLNSNVVTGAAGIAPFEWGALERAAIEDALEQEERIRKDTTTNCKKKAAAAAASMPKKTAKHSAQEAAFALAQVEAANKKLEKAVSLWRVRVAACIPGSVASLEKLLSESPLLLKTPGATSKQQQHLEPLFLSHLDFLASLCVPKNRNSISVYSETRLVLAKHLLEEFSVMHMFEPSRNGRSVVHMTCFFADIQILSAILIEAKRQLTPEQMRQQLMKRCQDSGWTPLHYASVSGSLRAVETILVAAGADVDQLVHVSTNDTHTWRKGSNKGISALYLLDSISHGKHGKMVETLGMALEDVIKHNKLSSTSTPANSLYLMQLSVVLQRLQSVESSGYTQLHEKEIAHAERDLMQKFHSSSVSATTCSASDQIVADDSWMDNVSSTSTKPKKSKKKKKKKQGSSVSSANKDDAATNASKTETTKSSNTATTAKTKSMSAVPIEDPLVTALKGMGFEEEQIMAGVKACGGIRRATADDVVAWIFGGGGASPDENEPHAQEQIEKEAAALKTKSDSELANQQAVTKTELDRVAAEKLAAKREEQRRRNREWNNKNAHRQSSETQEKLEKSRRQPAAALAPASDFFPSNTGLLGPPLGQSNTMLQSATGLKLESTHRKSTSTRLAGGALNLGTPAESGNAIDNALSNDASTVASSEIRGTIEIGGQDDATVSTMGSFPAVQAPAPTSFAPPGFLGNMQDPLLQNPHNTVQNTTPSWELHRTLSDPYGNSFTPLGVPGGMGPPPGIPESSPFPEQHSHHNVPGMRSHALNVPHSNLLNTGFSAGPHSYEYNAGSASSYNAGSASSHLGSGGFGNSDVSQHPQQHAMGGSLMGSSLLSGPGFGQHQQSTLPGGLDRGQNSGNAVPGLLGFGSGLNQSNPLDSSVIDSISTGNTAIMSGANLWGDASTTQAAGSSLLGNLISDRQQSDASNEGLFSGAGASFLEGNHVDPRGTWSSQTPQQGQQEKRSNSLRGSGSGGIW